VTKEKGSIMASTPPCAVCGGTQFTDKAVLWDALAEGWGLTPAERRLVDRQQGTCCTGCGGNLRSLALADAILAECGWSGTLEEFVVSEQAKPLRLLEVNEAGSLSSTLRKLPGHVFGAYPDLDMQAMHFEGGTFDLVVHSDTLEHVPDPIRALRECARVLTPEGALCFTVPVLPGRLSVDRVDLPPLYHGDPANPTEDLRVQTDYGADVWHLVHRAGFHSATLSRFGDGLAVTASRSTRRLGMARAEIRTRLAEFEADRRATEARLAQVAADQSADIQLLGAILRSTSWRVTRPMRVLVRAARRVLGSTPRTAMAENESLPARSMSPSSNPRPAASLNLRSGPEVEVHLRSLADWQQWVRDNAGLATTETASRIVADVLRDGLSTPLLGNGSTEAAKLVGEDPRESLIAGGLNARLRGVLQVLSTHDWAHDIWQTRIYAHEALTPFALRLRGMYPRFIGSEYASDEAAAQALWPVPVVDITRSAFPDASFHFVISNEVLEHVPDLDAALLDTARILRPGGQLIATFPFHFNAEGTMVRARLTADGVEHLQPPEYHGNPVDPEGGSLVFQIPGWDILDRCRKAGFADARVVFIISKRHGIIAGGPPGIFVLVATR